MGRAHRMGAEKDTPVHAEVSPCCDPGPAPFAPPLFGQQVVGRAHRMGAKKAVHMEVLAMQGTVEEHMLLRMGAAGTAGAAAAAAGAAAVHEAQAEAAPVAAPLAAQAAAAVGANASQAPAAAGASQAAVAAGRRQAATRVAAQLTERNEMLLSLRPVPVKDLEEFKDEPGGEDEDGGATGSAAETAEARAARGVVAAAEAAEAAADGGGGSGGEDYEGLSQWQAGAEAAAASVLASSARQLTWPEVAAGARRRQAGTSPRAPAAAEEPRQSGRQRSVRFAGDAEDDSEVKPAGQAAAGGHAASAAPAAAGAAATGSTAAVFVKPEPAVPEASTAAHAPAPAPAVPAAVGGAAGDAGVAAAAAAATEAAASVVVAAAQGAADLEGTPASKRRRTVSFAPSPSGASAGGDAPAAPAAAAAAAEAAPAAATAAGQEHRAPAPPLAAAAAAPGGPINQKRNKLLELVLQRTGARQASPAAAQPAAEQQGQPAAPAAVASTAPAADFASAEALPAAAAAAAPPVPAVVAAVQPPGAAAAAPPAPQVPVQPPAAAAAAPPAHDVTVAAAAAPPRPEASPAAAGDVRVLLLERCMLGAAQTAGLDQPLVGAFCAGGQRVQSGDSSPLTSLGHPARDGSGGTSMLGYCVLDLRTNVPVPRPTCSSSDSHMACSCQLLPPHPPHPDVCSVHAHGASSAGGRRSPAARDAGLRAVRRRGRLRARHALRRTALAHLPPPMLGRLRVVVLLHTVAWLHASGL